MSSNTSDNDESNSGVLSPRINSNPPVHRVNSAGLFGSQPSRHSVGNYDNFRESLWMDQYGGERQLFDALGYIQDPEYEHFRARYERTDTASALVDKLPQKAWKKPKIIDTGSGEEQSEFERVVDEFLAGEYTREDPINVMERATRMERLGNYSLIFIGLADDGAQPDGDTDEDGVDALENPIDGSSLDEMDPDEALSYITPYDQGRVDPEMIDWVEDDPTDARFGKPESYQVDFGDNRPTGRVHWSRVIHVVGEVFDDRYRSPSILKQGLNRIDDIEKILGGSAEGYWRAAYQGLVISPPEIDGQQTNFSDDGENLHQQINRYINNFSREIFTGAEIDTIDASAEDPTGHLESQYRDISVGYDIPQSILMGNETGELATEEDRRMWHERAGEFQDEYCLPVVLKPFIERLIEYNVFPEPEGGKHGWRVRWPPVDEKTEKEEMTLFKDFATGVSTVTGGNPLLAVSIEEIREKGLEWDPERGAEADDAGSDALEAVTAEDLEIDEQDARAQEQFSRLNQQYEEEQKVRTPDGRGVIVDVLTEGFEAEGEDVEASESSPTYVVVTESEDKPFGYYKADVIEAEDWNAGVEAPEEDLKEEGGEDRENALRIRLERALAALSGRENVAGDGRFTWPESWRESDKPARLIALDAWVSMGGSVDACIVEMRGEIADPGRFCADFADRLYMWDYWRGDSWAPGE